MIRVTYASSPSDIEGVTKTGLHHTTTVRGVSYFQGEAASLEEAIDFVKDAEIASLRIEKTRRVEEVSNA